MREQLGWAEHVQFINALMAEGIVILGGPLPPVPQHRALLVVCDRSESRARSRLAEDPWIRSKVLRLLSLEPWDIIVSNDRLDPALAEITQWSRDPTGMG